MRGRCSTVRPVKLVAATVLVPVSRATVAVTGQEIRRRFRWLSWLPGGVCQRAVARRTPVLALVLVMPLEVQVAVMGPLLRLLTCMCH